MPPTSALPTSALVDLVQRLSLVRDLSSLTAMVTRCLRDLMAAEGATFVLRRGDNCFYAEESAVAPLFKGKLFPIERCIGGWAMRHRRAAVIPDIRDDPRIPWEAYRPTFVKSLIMAPVRVEAPIAAIGAYWATPRQPSAEEVALVETVAHSAALAMQNLELVESLREASTSKSRLLAAIGHDLRQPLQSLALYSSLLDASLPAERLAAAGEQIGLAVDRMADLLGAILALGELDSGRIATRARPVMVDSLLAPIADEMTADATAKGLELRRVPSSLMVTSDPALLGPMLRNLATNALRYTEQGRVLLGARRSGGKVHIVVADTGIGIPAAHHRAVFEEFFQVGNSARDFSAGTGVGLAMVRRMADLLGHRLSLRSAEGRGSIFTIEAPLATA